MLMLLMLWILIVMHPTGRCTREIVTNRYQHQPIPFRLETNFNDSSSCTFSNRQTLLMRWQSVANDFIEFDRLIVINAELSARNTLCCNRFVRMIFELTTKTRRTVYVDSFIVIQRKDSGAWSWEHKLTVVRSQVQRLWITQMAIDVNVAGFNGRERRMRNWKIKENDSSIRTFLSFILQQRAVVEWRTGWQNICRCNRKNANN